jgi:uncharacterized protein YdeI (YjbR/CyaY-like superfamily)
MPTAPIAPSAKPNKLKRPRQVMPAGIRRELEKSGLLAAYRGRPPYQRNDYLGWIARAKREETRQKRLQQMLDELKRGDTYMNMTWHPAAARG